MTILTRMSSFKIGIGELLDPLDMGQEPKIIDVNLTGMVRTAAGVIPRMARRGQGHFIRKLMMRLGGK